MQPNLWSPPELLLLFLWPLIVFALAFGTCFFFLTLLRNRMPKTALWINGIVSVVFWLVWYFYPSFNYRGTYKARVERWEQIQITTIDDKFYFQDYISGEYRVNPFTRMMWVTLDEPLAGWDIKELPVKLRWKYMYQPVYKCGWVKFKKAEPPETPAE